MPNSKYIDGVVIVSYLKPLSLKFQWYTRASTHLRTHSRTHTLFCRFVNTKIYYYNRINTTTTAALKLWCGQNHRCQCYFHGCCCCCWCCRCYLSLLLLLFAMKSQYFYSESPPKRINVLVSSIKEFIEQKWKWRKNKNSFPTTTTTTAPETKQIKLNVHDASHESMNEQQTN